MLKIARIVLPLLFAGVLIGGLIVWSGLSFGDFKASLREVSPGAVVGILVCTALFLTLSAFKWRLVMGQVAPQGGAAPAWDFSLYYTAMGAVLSLVITPHAAMVVSRSVGAKLHSKGTATASAAASAYEQLFDVIPLAIMSFASLLALGIGASATGWLAIAGGLNAAALFAIILLFRRPFWTVANFIPLPKDRRAALRQKLEWFSTPAARTMLSGPFVGLLFATSLVRYAIIMLRTWLVVAALNLPISTFEFAKAYGVSRLSSIISVTPGELGISEWTWSGVLSWMGTPLDDAARFVLVNRICNDVSLVAVFGVAWVAFTLLVVIRTSKIESRALRP